MFQAPKASNFAHSFLFFLLLLCFLSSPAPLYGQAESDLETSEMMDEEIEEEYEEEYEEEVKESVKKPTITGSIQLQQLFQSINKDSRLNPDNRISDLNDSNRQLEIELQLSDYFNEEESWRWLIKSYSRRFYEKGKDSSTESDIETSRFNEVYIDWATGDSFFSLGKRRNSWGPALAFNPVNVVVPPRDPLSPGEQTEGHPMFLFNYGGEIITVDLILTRDYDKDWDSKYNRWGARISALFGEMDFGFYYFDGESGDAGNRYNRMTGFSYSGNFLENATLYIETATFVENGRNYYGKTGAISQKEKQVIKSAIGSSITIDGNTTLMIEFYNNSAGYSTEERENYFDAVDAVVKPTFNPAGAAIFADNRFGEMNQNYLLISYDKREIYEKFAFGLQGIFTTDSSSVLELSGTYNLSDYYQCETKVTKNIGGKYSEFGNSDATSQLELILNASF